MKSDRVLKNLHEAKGMLPFLVPVIVEQLFLMIIGMVNTMLASRLSSQAVSAISSVNMINFIVISLFQIIAVGATIVIAQAIGRGDQAEANHSSAQALSSTFILSIVVVILLSIARGPLVELLYGQADADVKHLIHQYWALVIFYYPAIALSTTAYGVSRGAGDMKLPMKVSIIMHLTNVVLGYGLMYGIPLPGGARILNLGVAGSAWALLIANYLGAGLILYRLFKGTRALHIEREDALHWDRRALQRILQLGVPGGGEQIMFNSGKLLIQSWMMGLGTAAIAANSITGALVSVLIVVPNAMPIVATTVVGQYIGRGDKEGARSILLKINNFGVGVMVLTALIAFPFSEAMLRLFTDDREILAISLGILHVYYLAMPTQPFAFTLPSGLRGAGDVRSTMVVSVLATWVVRVILSYLFLKVWNIGVGGVWYAMYIDWVFRLIFFLPRTLGRKWFRYSSS